MGWDSCFDLTIDIDEKNMPDLKELDDKLWNHEIQDKVSELTHTNCNMNGITFEKQKHRLILKATAQKGTYRHLVGLVELVKFIIGKNVRRIIGRVYGADSYADCQLHLPHPSPTVFIYKRNQKRSHSV